MKQDGTRDPSEDARAWLKWLRRTQRIVWSVLIVELALASVGWFTFAASAWNQSTVPWVHNTALILGYLVVVVTLTAFTTSTLRLREFRPRIAAIENILRG